VKVRDVLKLRPLTAEEKAALDEFCRTMREEVVPQVSDEVLEREVLAIESRARLLR